ncbi:TPM domain-containing protein [Streptomyces sp. URMC 126]|uniref:TPM domain-containing protein n=1 Tax=Streptomyces sp. URMC 126 TaxID=3423401 RepID=UPI003F1AA4E7
MTRLLRRYGPGAPGPAIAGALFALCVLLLPAPSVARAETPLDLDATGHITDTVGALGRRRPQVEAALARLAGRHVRLYVTYVHDFSGRTGREWADATADRNGLGPQDVLLAVATSPRQFAVSAAQDSGFRADQLRQVATVAIAPALKAHDWAGAAIGAADGYRSVLAGQAVRPPVIVPGPSDPGSSGLLPGDRRFWVPVAAGALLCLAGLLLRRHRRRRARRRVTVVPFRAPVTVSASTEPGLARMAQPLTPLPDLETEASLNLVATDDAVRTSAEELTFALAQLGEAATLPFAEAVGYARGELAAAFRLRQRLDDAPLHDDDFRRHALDEICSRCTSANRRLDAEAAAFDRLRGLRANAAAVLGRAEAVARELEPRIDAAENTLFALRHRCAEEALAPVWRYPAEARDRLAFAGAALEDAHTALAEDDRDRAAVSVRAAEAALSQARTLTTAALRHACELNGAARRLAAALADAEAAAAASGRREGAAVELLTAARREAACRRIDPRAVLRRIDEAAAALDDDLPPDDPGRAARTRTRTARTLLAARARVVGARDFIATHRGAVGARARTRLAEAERHLDLARRDPAEAPRAETLALQARAAAERDVGVYGIAHSAPDAARPARALGGALLGGIVLAGLLPATFGGGATRGRLAAPER